MFIVSNHFIEFKAKCLRQNRLLLLSICTHSFASSGYLNVTDSCFFLEGKLIYPGNLQANKDIYFPNEIRLAPRS